MSEKPSKFTSLCIILNYLARVTLLILIELLLCLFLFVNFVASRLVMIGVSMILVSIVRVVVTYAFGVSIGAIFTMVTAVGCLLLIITSRSFYVPIKFTLQGDNLNDF